MEQTPTALELADEIGIDLLHIREAYRRSAEKIQLATQALASDGLPPSDTAVVAFGSLARREVTSGSDFDWSFLLDGLADPAHHAAAQRVDEAMRKALELRKPGATGTFGSMVVSHDLIHRIGGDDDSNQNMTRRMLLLLESVSLGGIGSAEVHRRCVESVIYRYLEEEASLDEGGGDRKVPRFLMNDVVRFWRTMAVDYARKVRERKHDGWAIRNVKLRMSRKLLLVVGILACLEVKLRPGHAVHHLWGDELLVDVKEHLATLFAKTPLDVLARAVHLYVKPERRADIAAAILGPYDVFLGLLDSHEARETLSTLSVTGSEDNQVFRRGREAGQQFQDGLLRLMYEEDDGLSRAVKLYGVF